MTSYYLLLKKSDAGKLDLEEQEILDNIENKNESLLKQPEKNSHNPAYSSNLSFLQNTSNMGSTSSNKSGSREPRAERGLPLLNPQLNINDITYSIKEKITINTAPNKKLAGTTNNFNIYINRSSREESPIQVQVPNFNASMREKRTENHKNERPENHYTNPNRAGKAGSSLIQTKHTISKSFDFEGQPARSSNQNYSSNKTYTKTPNHQIENLATDLKKSPSQESEPKSRKLLEMMLKRLSKGDTEEDSSYNNRYSRNAAPTSGTTRNWDTKSISMENNKKKNVYSGKTTTEQYGTSSRPSSRERPSFANYESVSHSGTSTYANKSILLKNNKQIQLKNWRIRNPLMTGNN